jgi:aconitate hydratase
MMIKMARYLKATGRADVAELADGKEHHLTADAEVYANPEKYFDQVIEINLSELEPHVNGPFTPDLATPISKLKEAALKKTAGPENFSWSYRFMYQLSSMKIFHVL